MSYLNQIQNFILDWNLENPIDHWWRTRYNVPFGSPSHLDMDMIDMRISFEELEMHKRIENEIEKRKEREEDRLLGTVGLETSGKEVVHMSKKEIDEEYDNLDLSQFADKNPLQTESDEH